MMKHISKERTASPSSFFKELRRRRNRTGGGCSCAISGGESPFTRSDADVLRAAGALPERGFRAVEAVGRRCSYGFPQVLRCSPFLRGQPFPTSYWLVCPYLRRVIGGLEAENGVAALQDALCFDPCALYDYHRLHVSIRLSMLSGARKRFLRLYRKALYRPLTRGGVGGIAYGAGEIRVKCLHLQAASYLALGFHPAARFLEERIGRWTCADGICLSNT